MVLNGKFDESEIYSALGLLDSGEGKNSEIPRVASLLSTVLERSIQKDENLLKASKKKDVVTIFHGSRVPSLSVRQYVERIVKYSSCNPSCFVVAYIYMDRFLQRTDAYLTYLNVHRLLITSIMIAEKFFDDEVQKMIRDGVDGRFIAYAATDSGMPLLLGIIDQKCFNNAYYAKVGGVSTAEMNRLEMEFLFTLEFRLHVTTEVFTKYCLQLEKAGARAKEQ